jgi:hypothetical protein
VRPIVLLGLLLAALGFYCPQSQAVTFSGVQQCNNYGNVTSTSCNLQNTVNPNKVVVLIKYHPNGGVLTLTCTEACTLEASTTTGAGQTLAIYDVDTTTTHADFSITAAVTCGGACDTHITAYEIAGLSSGIDTTAAANSNSTTFTTAHANEFAVLLAWDNSGALAPANSFQALSAGASISGNFGATSVGQRLTGAWLITTTATTYTAGFTTTSSSDPAVVVVSYQTSGGVIGTSGYPLQTCSLFLIAGNNPTSAGCRLYNTTLGNVIHDSWYTGGGVSDNGSTEALAYPSGAQICPSGTCHAAGQGYVITTAGHATFDAGITTTGGNAIGSLQVQESSGLGAFDSGSAAAASATTVNFTTASNNEMAFCLGHSTATATIVPGNSFIPTLYGVDDSNVNRMLMAQKLISTAGSNTFSYTQTGNATPVVSCFAFGIVTTANSRKHSAIL